MIGVDGCRAGWVGVHWSDDDAAAVLTDHAPKGSARALDLDRDLRFGPPPRVDAEGAQAIRVDAHPNTAMDWVENATARPSGAKRVAAVCA